MVRAGSNVQATFGFRPEYEVVTECRGTGRPAATGHRLVQFSSGSTGRPKVIGRTAASLAAEVDRFAGIGGMPGEGDRVLLLSSTAHSFGLVAGLLHSLAAGVSVVFAPRISARDLLRTAVDHRITALFGVPMHYELLAAAVDPPELPDLRVAVSGGELMPPDVAARFTERYGVPVGESYGTTESGVVAMDVGGTLRPSVGPAAPGMVVRVRRANWTSPSTSRRISSTPAVRSTRTAGCVRGTGPRSTAPGPVPGALGRADSLVVIGGLKVDLTEVENVLRGHPAVEQAVVVHEGVTEAYVVTSAAGFLRGVAAVVSGAARRLQVAAGGPAVGRVASYVQREACAPAGAVA
jgi:acyl-coenzyme A synthetase/AMP-(fatty) acid ligase